MTQCAEKDCARAATHYLRVTVAPYGHPIARGMTMSLGLQLCLDHARSTKASQLFDAEGQKKLRQLTAIVTRSAVPLDFTRTKIEVRPIGDADWQILTSKQGSQ